jgi:hypothetical protein
MSNRLMMQVIRNLQREIDEAYWNQQFPIKSHFHLFGLISANTHQPIPEENYTNQIYHLYTHAILTDDHAKEQKYLRILKTQINKAEPLVKAFIDQYKNIDITENIREGVWTKTTCGVLSYEDYD